CKACKNNLLRQNWPITTLESNMSKHRFGHVSQTAQHTACTCSGTTCRPTQELRKHPTWLTQAAVAHGMLDAVLARPRKDILHQCTDHIFRIKHCDTPHRYGCITRTR